MFQPYIKIVKFVPESNGKKTNVLDFKINFTYQTDDLKK